LGFYAAAVGLALYAAAIAAEGARMALRHERWCALIVPSIFCTTHLAHACGMACGLLYYACNPDWQRCEPPRLSE
jgi:hypothetical protein